MKTKTLRHSAAILVASLLAVSHAVAETPCEGETDCYYSARIGGGRVFQSPPLCTSSRFWFESEPVSGAPGDVVGVTFSVQTAADFDFPINSIRLVVCHDPMALEIVGDPVYSPELLDRQPILLEFFPIHDDLFPGVHSDDGFLSRIGPMPLSSVVGPMPLLTVYYRLIGAPGHVSELGFCDGSLMPVGECQFNTVSNTRNFDGRTASRVSTRNRNAAVTIHDGPITRPDRPQEPPPAIVYDAALTSAEVDLHVRVDRAVALPGQREVPVDVFVTAGVEYTALIVPIDFDERYLRVARVEDYFLSGTAIVDNEDTAPGAQAEEGYVVIASSLGGTRRIAAVGEEFRAATIYFEVLESASAITETTLVSRSVGGRVPHTYVVVRHRTGENAGQVESQSEFGAIEIAGGVLAIRPSLEALPGDANFDGAFDIADPVSVLGFLFLGFDALLCPGAADYDGDARLDISDPIAMLGVLFSGLTPPVTGEERILCR